MNEYNEFNEIEERNDQDSHMEAFQSAEPPASGSLHG